MNDESRQHVINSLRENIRIDGRTREAYREISIETGFTKNAEGSAKVKIGDTEVMAGVKLSVESPYGDTPDQGNLMVNVELLPLSNPEFESGPPSIDAIELARVVDRGIRESKAIDVKKLCIKPGEKVWMVSIDICSINDDGNLFDASALAAVAAIRDAKFPEFDGKTLDYKKLTKNKLPLTKVPVTVTVWKIGDNLIIDPLKEEEKASSARITVASTEDGNLCAMQKGGDAALSMEELKKMIELGLSKASELRKVMG